MRLMFKITYEYINAMKYVYNEYNEMIKRKKIIEEIKWRQSSTSLRGGG